MVVAGANFRFGRGRSGDLELLRRLGLDVRAVPLVEGASSTRIRDLLRAGEVERAARLLGRPAEVAGTVVAGDARGGTLGFPTANLRPEPGLLVPGYGIYAGAADGRRAAISIGTNPHYGGDERRIEAFLLDFSGDLYGGKLRLELWERLRDERVFESEADLVAQIGRDVEATRRAVPRPDTRKSDDGNASIPVWNERTPATSDSWCAAWIAAPSTRCRSTRKRQTSARSAAESAGSPWPP